MIALGLGIGVAVLSLANLLGAALEDQPLFVFAFFGGLILASIVAIGITLKWTPTTVVALVIGAVAAFVIVGLTPPTGEADHSLPVLFVSGMIAICAMILPGISGSFILLILGQYASSCRQCAAWTSPAWRRWRRAAPSASSVSRASSVGC